MRAWIRKSFRNRIFVTILMTTLIPLLLCSVIMMQLQVNRSEAKQKEQGTQELQDIGILFSGVLQQISETTEELCDNTMVHSALRRGKENSRVTYQLLFRLTDELRQYARFDIYDNEGNCRYTTDSTVSAGKLETYWGILYAAGESTEFVIQRNRTEEGLIAAKAIRDHSENILGYVVISMSGSNFDELFSGCYDASNSLFLVDARWNTIYLTRPAAAADMVPMLRRQLLQGEELKDNLGEANYLLQTDEMTGFTLVLRQPKIFTKPVKQTIHFVSGIMGLLCLSLCLWASWMLSRSLAHPVNRLDEAMKEIRKGNFDVSVTIAREDEFGHLSESFNLMTEEYKKNLVRSVEHQKELNATQIRMLQAQLNPHFLYNTLDSIKWMGVVHKAPDIAAMATNLAALLRASISGNDIILLSEELELIERYIEIQSVRFEDRFTCEIDIAEQFQNCLVPKLVLQPLVENAIIHGVVEREDGYIKLSAQEEDGDLLISVADNGCGMPEDVLEQLQRAEKKVPGQHLGLYNVSSIIRLHFGENYGISVESVTGSGSCVRVRLPIQRGGKEC